MYIFKMRSNHTNHQMMVIIAYSPKKWEISNNRIYAVKSILEAWECSQKDFYDQRNLGSKHAQNFQKNRHAKKKKMKESYQIKEQLSMNQLSTVVELYDLLEAN